jgi:hypothetical protein
MTTQEELLRESLSNLKRARERDAARIAELEAALRFYAAENHMASDESSHNRLNFENCTDADCVNARALLKGSQS